MLSQHKNSWVAGRTGFGPVVFKNDMGLSKHVIEGVGYSASVDPLYIASNVEATLVGPYLICDSLESEVSDVVDTGGGQVESYVEDSVEDPGHVLLATNTLGDFEVEALPVTKNLRLTGEVGSIVGLSCDGQ